MINCLLHLQRKPYHNLRPRSLDKLILWERERKTYTYKCEALKEQAIETDDLMNWWILCHLFKFKLKHQRCLLEINKSTRI